MNERKEVCSVYCVVSRCENRMSIQFCLCVVSKKESAVIVVDGGIFLSRCLTVALPCRC